MQVVSCFFFFKQKTAYEIGTGDWSSDVCSSDPGRVICGLSGGVDSSVAAVLIHEAIGSQLTCVYVDHGLMRMNESEQVVSLFREHYNIPLVHVDASDLFLGELAGVSDPEKKRKTIGKLFIDGASGVANHDDAAADATVKVDWEGFGKLRAGEMDPTMAFMQGKLKVLGDMSVAMQLQSIMSKLS